MKTKRKPKRKDIYDREIDRMVEMEFEMLERIWADSDNARVVKGAKKSILFSSCGNYRRRSCGCPTLIVGFGLSAQTAALTKAIRNIPDIPASFDDLGDDWNRSTPSRRRKLLLPFAIAQRMTDKVLKKLAKGAEHE